MVPSRPPCCLDMRAAAAAVSVCGWYGIGLGTREDVAELPKLITPDGGDTKVASAKKSNEDGVLSR